MLEALVRFTIWLDDDDRGVTTVEWLGMAAIAVLVIAMLLPQVRSASGNLWNTIVNQLTGFFN